MASTRKIAFSLILAGSLACLLTSCGEDGGTEPPCINCDFWSRPFDRIARFPAVSPTDPNLIAFVSTDVDTTVECRQERFNHIWVARLPELEGEDTRFYQITFACAGYHDFEPAWSPDGSLIAFERRFEGGISDIFVVDVSDLENPGLPVQFTDRATLPQSNYSPAWVVVGGDTYLAFSNSKSGGNDYDIGMYSYPDRGAVIWLSADPYDYAVEENSVLSATFKDQQVCGNGSNVVVFSSPDRLRVCDIKVLARSRETYPESTAVARIYLNGKDSGVTTPHTFRYRPATDLEISIEGAIDRYCTNAADTLLTEPETINTVVLEFEYKEGTVGFASEPGVKDVFYDGRKLEGIRTPGFPTDYEYAKCLAPGAHTAYAVNILDGQRCSPIVEFTVAAGETTLVFLDCTGGGLASESVRPSPGTVEGRSQEPRLASALTLPNGIWLVDLKDQASSGDDKMYQVMSSASTVCQPSLSPDGRYVAYIVGEGIGRRILVSDVSGLYAGGTAGEPVAIGLPGSPDQTECWRLPERVEWLPGATGRKMVVSLSVCRGGAVPDDFETWVADLSRFLE